MSSIETMSTPPERKKRPGRPPLPEIDKQRNLVRRLGAASSEIETKLIEHSRLDDLIRVDLHTATERLETLHARLHLARHVAHAELSGDEEQARQSRSELNAFRPLGVTLSGRDLIHEDNRHAPGKPRLALELEYARLEIQRISAERTLQALEANDDSNNDEALQESEPSVKKNVGRPSTGNLGKLDRQLHIALYQKRDLKWNHRSVAPKKGSRGRPQLPLETRIERLDEVIDTCRKLIAEGEQELIAEDLQRRLLKRLRDAAARVRASMRSGSGAALIHKKALLERLEEDIEIEADFLRKISSGDENTEKSLTDIRALVQIKTATFDDELYLKTVDIREQLFF